jgi:hypothetical protein
VFRWTSQKPKSWDNRPVVDLKYLERFGMDFYAWQTERELVGMKGDPRFSGMAQAACERLESEGNSLGVNMLYRTRAEEDWNREQRPYFRVWPSMTPALSTANIDLPFSVLKLPFRCFSVSLAAGDRSIVFGEHGQLRSMLVSKQEVLPKHGGGVRLFVECQLEQPTADNEKRPIPYHLSAAFVESDNIEQRFREYSSRIDSADAGRKALSLAAAVIFLATGADKLVTPHVLNDDLQAYVDAARANNEGRVRTLTDRARRRRRSIGMEIGRYEAIRQIFTTHHGVDEEPIDHLKFSHQRRAHFRRLASGKVVFIRQVTVRADLPPAPLIATRYDVA